MRPGTFLWTYVTTHNENVGNFLTFACTTPGFGDRREEVRAVAGRPGQGVSAVTRRTQVEKGSIQFAEIEYKE